MTMKVNTLRSLCRFSSDPTLNAVLKTGMTTPSKATRRSSAFLRMLKGGRNKKENKHERTMHSDLKVYLPVMQNVINQID